MGAKIALVGFGKSHRALAQYLLSQGQEIVVLEKKPMAVLDDVIELQKAGVDFITGSDYLAHLDRYTTVFLTPGMPKDLPEIESARKHGVQFTGEVPYFLEHSIAPVLGVTGSAGKTTTTTMLGLMLKQAGVSTYVGGNIGLPLISLLPDLKASDRVVAELSSFQLELSRVSPTVGLYLNLQPNHLDVHGDMAHYAEAKSHIFGFQNTTDYAVYNADDAYAQAAVSRSPAQKIRFSMSAPVDVGTYLQDNWLYLRDGMREHRLLRVDQIKVPGAHNVANVLAAAAAVLTQGDFKESIIQVARTFSGVPHRLEKVAVIDGVTYLNDSIATSPDRTIAALKTVPGPIFLIAGGYDKHLDYAPLKPYLSKIHTLFLIGQTADKIAAVADGETTDVVWSGTLEQAVYEAKKRARVGDTVLLSPASASYDQFPNFEIRGELFRTLVLSDGAPTT